MRLSAWRSAAPSKEAVAPKVTAAVDAILSLFGAGSDPESWVAWGEEPGHRYTILVPTPAGLVTCYVRVNVPGEGPRATGKLVRWGRVQFGELSIETQGAHRLLSFQVEQLVLRGADKEADRIAAFAQDLLAVADGRPAPTHRAGPSAKASTGSRAASGRGSGASKGAAASKPAVPRLPARAGAAKRPSRGGAA